MANSGKDVAGDIRQRLAGVREPDEEGILERGKKALLRYREVGEYKEFAWSTACAPNGLDAVGVTTFHMQANAL